MAQELVLSVDQCQNRLEERLPFDRNARHGGRGEPQGSSPLRARRSDRKTLSLAPFFVAKVFTGAPGRYIPLQDTIEGFSMIVNAEPGPLPERAF